ncbi:hypothetical protein Q31b_19010 [Novipirellula aureliae]|uniref:Right handed beta helix domain-containing protein n=1 Tax=Novipirellula aureliae TaxID=2527966 RepID=A0A5C6E730_9BACT|nr:right-handed parallel beta-helix repeat-containing protein [Novipirellula aureliae]TWU44365.1 hypothetical protein Q31b_19010 [Novipirellula aureliae]
MFNRSHPFWFITFVALVCISAHSQDHARVEIHVSSDADPGGDGSVRAPFRSLVEARDWIRQSRVSGDLPTGQAVTVLVGSGEYVFDSTFELSSEDSGSSGAAVIYRAEKRLDARLLGGITLSPKSFEPVSDPEILNRLDPQIRQEIRVISLPGPRGEFQQLGDAYRSVPTAPWLYIDGMPMQLARWPNANADNEGWASFSKVIDTGMANPLAKNKEQQEKHPGSFVFDDPRLERWQVDQGVWLRGYWTHDWADEVIRVASYNSDEKIITLAAPHAYGIMSGTWGQASRRFYALNVLEELDQPGEWYLDRKRNKLYLYPTDQFKSASIVLATLSEPLIRVKNAKHLRFEGLSIGYGHGDGMVLQATEHVEVAGCEIANLARTGIRVSGGENTVRSCHLFNLGTSGISISGGDRHTLTPANNLAVNNHIHHYGRFQRTYAPGIGVSGCGQVVRNNSIHDAPHNAVLYGGNEHLFERNEIYRVVMETGDAGAFYSGRDWTSQGNTLRHNYIHHLGAGDAKHVNTMGVYLDDCDCGDTIEGNVFYRAGRAIMIGGGRSNPVINNLVVDCPIGLHIDSRGMTWEHWNSAKHSGWNLEEKAQALNYQKPPWSDRYPQLAMIMSDSPREPLYNPIHRNVFVNITSQVWSRDKNVDALMDKFEIENNLVVNTRGDEAAIAMAKDQWEGFRNLAGSPAAPIELGFVDADNQDFSLRDDARLRKELPAFEPIPMHQIGLYIDPAFQ